MTSQRSPADDFFRRLLSSLDQLPPARRFWVAYSGGRDSTVLLHALSGIRAFLSPDLQLCAVHVDHGLSPYAGAWARHCEAVCARLGIPCHTLRVNAVPQSGESPEAAARQARYQAIASLIEAGDCLLTAHHQDDQAETLLLQLLRGAGPHGLAAMPVYAPFANGCLARPLLGFTRDELAVYAAQHDLSWVDDHSNFDTGFERNYLRHEVMPHFMRRWPACASTLSRAAVNAAEAAALLDVLADNDLQALRGPLPGTLLVSQLLKLDDARQRNALRRWFKILGLPAPWAAHLQRVQCDVLAAAEDSTPCVCWAGAEVRRYRDLLYAMPPLPVHDASTVLAWDLEQSLILPDGNGRLTAYSMTGSGLKASLCYASTVSVRFRQGGERCRPAGRGHTHILKKLLQEQGIPPWQRDRIPLIYVGDQLAAVAELWVCEPFQAGSGEAGIALEWSRQHSFSTLSPI